MSQIEDLKQQLADATGSTAETSPPALKIGGTVPNFQAETSMGNIDFYDHLGDSWGILFSHPNDYTPVCTTELGMTAKLASEFEKRNVKFVGLSCNDVSNHQGWIKDIDAYNSTKVNFPIVADKSRQVALMYNMLDAEEVLQDGSPMSVRTVFIISPDKKLKLQLSYPASTGRNFDEIIRCIDSLQLTSKYKVATPVNWVQGGDCMLTPGVTQAEHSNYPKGVTVVDIPSKKPYLRVTPQPDH
jgi:1-Cys peroxiredoxin 6